MASGLTEIIEEARKKKILPREPIFYEDNFKTDFNLDEKVFNAEAVKNLYACAMDYAQKAYDLGLIKARQSLNLELKAGRVIESYMVESCRSMIPTSMGFNTEFTYSIDMKTNLERVLGENGIPRGRENKEKYDLVKSMANALVFKAYQQAYKDYFDVSRIIKAK